LDLIAAPASWSLLADGQDRALSQLGVFDALDPSFRPADLQAFDAFAVAQPEVQTKISLGEITRAAATLLDQPSAAGGGSGAQLPTSSREPVRTAPRQAETE
jgi:hypothetical protein